MPRLSGRAGGPTSWTDHGDTLREGAARGAGPGAGGCHQRAWPWLCWGLPLHPTAGGGCGAPRNFLPPPRRTTSCFHRALCTSWVASAPSFPRQPRCIRRRARGQGAPRRPSQAARSSTEGWPGPCPPCHPVPAPHSRCLAPHQFQAWGPSHGAGAPPGHTTWPTSSSLATSALTEPLTQPQHPAVLPCIVCCSPCHAPRSPSTPAPLTVLGLSAGSAAAGLSAREQEPRDSSSSSQALTAGAGLPWAGFLWRRQPRTLTLLSSGAAARASPRRGWRQEG